MRATDAAKATGGRARIAALTWALVIGYAGIIYHLSSQSHPLAFLPPELFVFDKALHGTEYAALGALLAFALLRSGVRPVLALAAAAALASAYGVSDEWHQSFVPGRDPDWHDWAADTVGALAGAALVVGALRARGARASIPRG
jgi:VanZ family protein